MPFKHVVNLRPALMKPTAGQVHVGTALRLLASVLARVAGLEAITLKQLGRAMINAANGKAPKQVLEVPDIVALAEA
jgi:hypothetical protein